MHDVFSSSAKKLVFPLFTWIYHLRYKWIILEERNFWSIMNLFLQGQDDDIPLLLWYTQMSGFLHPFETGIYYRIRYPILKALRLHKSHTTNPNWQLANEINFTRKHEPASPCGSRNNQCNSRAIHHGFYIHSAIKQMCSWGNVKNQVINEQHVPGTGASVTTRNSIWAKTKM